MKKLLAAALISASLVLGWGASATNLAPGDLVITTVNTDSAFTTVGCPNPSSTNNLFAFVNRVDMSSGTVVYFTDNARSGSTWTASEGTIVFTATNLIPAGTTNYYNDCSPGAFPAIWSRVAGFDPASAGDNIIAYQGTGIAPANPNFIYAVGLGSATPWISSGSPTTNNSYIPTGLTSGTTAVIPTTLRNAQYKCTNADIGSPTFLSALGTTSNRTGSSTTGFLAAPCIYLPPFDLSLVKIQMNTGGLSTGFVRVGQLIAYQLTLRSVFGVVTNATVQDVLPLGFTYVSHSATTGVYTTGSSLWNVSSLASGATATLTITGTINQTGTIFNTASIFSFSGTDQSGANNTGTVSITGVLTQPTAVNDSGTITEDGSGVIAVLQNDIAGSGIQILSITGVTSSAHGIATIVGTGIQYVPSPNYCGTDTFTYMAKNQYEEESIVAATVALTITCVNDAPQIILNGMGDKTDENTAVHFYVISPTEHAFDYVNNGVAMTNALQGNYITDLDHVPNTLLLNASTQPAYGTVLWSGLDFVYTPNTGYCNQDQQSSWDNPTKDSFDYTVIDASGAVSNTGTMQFVILCTDTNPVAVMDVQSGVEDTQLFGDVSLNDSAPDLFYNANAYLADYVIDTQQVHGTLNFDQSNGQYDYTPNQDRCGEGIATSCDTNVLVIKDALANNENFMSFEDIIHNVSYAQGIHLWDVGTLDAFIANDPMLAANFAFAYDSLTDTATFTYIGTGGSSQWRITTDMNSLTTYSFGASCSETFVMPTDTSSLGGSSITHFYGLENETNGIYYPIDSFDLHNGVALSDEVAIDAYIAADSTLSSTFRYTYDAMSAVGVFDYIGGGILPSWRIYQGDTNDYTEKKLLNGLYTGGTIGSVPADYFSYHVLDGRGFSSSSVKVRLPVACVNDLPVITLVGNDPEQVLLHSVYTDAGATASDAEDGDITTGIVMSGSVDINTLGTYMLTYNVTDSQSGSAMQVTRTVHVIAGGLPTISLMGSGIVSQPALVPYVESGAVYSDAEDGSGTVTNISGIVLTGVLGTYIVTYDYTDMQGNIASQVTRTVTITAPVCEPGKEGNISTGNVASCALCAPGSANAATGGTCFQCAPGTFAANAGSLTCDTCPTGLSSSTGASSCVDTTPPVVTLQGSGTIVVLLNTTFTDPGATWVDVIDGSGVANESGSVNTSVTGSYILSYTYVDAAGNTGNTVSRTVIVTEGNMPIITLNDAAIITQDAFTPYIESGAVYSDVEDGTGMVVNISGTVHTGEVGTYTITYDYTDTQGNAAVQVTRIVHIVAPICAAGQELTMSGSVPSCLSCPIGSSNGTAGGSCVQCAAGTFADVTASLSCSPCPIGMTSITGASSCSDTIAPLVTLTGASMLSLLQGMPYVELGAMWTDSVDGSGIILMPFSGNVQTSVVGVYTLYYRYTDAAGNTGNIVTRQVTITAIPIEPTTTGSAGFGGGGGGSSAAAIAAAVAGATKPATLPVETPTNVPSDSQVFNPTITGLCYERNVTMQLTGSSSLAVHKDFPAALRFLVSYELTKYNTINSYRPLDSLTREEAAKLFTQYARNVLCRQPNADTINYSDIASADQTLVPYLSLAYQLTLMHGDSKGTFRPKAAITKPEFLAVLVRTILYSYLDETSQQRYDSYEQVGKDLAIITQDIDPLAKGISRHDAALMLFRAYRYQQYGVFDKGYDTYILQNYEGVIQKYQ